MRQAIAQVLAGDGHHQTQVGHHQPAGGIDGFMVAQVAREALLFLGGQQRNTVDSLDVAIQIAQCAGEGEREAASGGILGGHRQTASHLGLVGRQNCGHAYCSFRFRR
ncbi:hypothetical protein D3C81_898320 [compost metagenome]